jgi:hypothetical protein
MSICRDHKFCIVQLETVNSYDICISVYDVNILSLSCINLEKPIPQRITLSLLLPNNGATLVNSKYQLSFC